MKILKLKTDKPFRDLKEGVVRFVGTEFEATEERYQELENRLPGFVSIVGEAPETEVAAETLKKPSKKAGRKPKEVAEDDTE